MKKNDLSVFEIEKEGLRLKLQRGRPDQTTTSTSTETASLPKIAIVPAETGKPADTSSLKDIVSPMVGTFYRAGSPDGAPFVDVGKTVTEDTVRSEEHTSELQSRTVISYAVFCLKKK